MEIYDILKITIPALLVLLTAWILIDKHLKNDQKYRDYVLQLKNQSVTTPLRLRAYERLMLVLERTKPTKLVVANIESDMNCFSFQAKLLNVIRDEFAHNAAQQIYVSNELWTAIRAANENLVKLINISASMCSADLPATVLAEKIIEIYSQTESFPDEIATEMLKKEVRNLY